MTHPNPLYGAWLKLVRAQEHLQTLDTEVRNFLDANPYGFTTKLDYEHSRYLFYTNRVEEPPARFGLLLGDYVHNLRSALDHLAWQLALQKYGGAVPRKARRLISYPIAHDLKAFRKLEALRHFKAEHVALLEEFQPKQRTPYNNLTLLNDLWNTDKHRFLHGTLVTVADSPKFTGNSDADVREVWYAKGEKLVVGTQFACIQIVRRGPNPKVDMEGLRVSLLFGNCPDRALNALTDQTTDILNSCQEAFFSA